MELNEFIKRLFELAKENGMDASEAYILENERFQAVANEGEILRYTANTTRGLGFRAMKDGKVGCAFTEAFDEDAARQLVRGAMDSLMLCEDNSRQFFYQGTEADPVLNLMNPALEQVPSADKLKLALDLEKYALAADKRIVKSDANTVTTGKVRVRLVNSYGLDKSYEDCYCGAYLEPIAKDGEQTTTGFELKYCRDFAAIDAKALAEAAVAQAVGQLGAEPIASCKTPVIIHNLAITDLLEAFSGVFSADSAQRGLSLLKGKLGETIAAPCVTLVDDPLLPDGLASRPFDAEGVPSGKHVVVENGVFKTFLHNLKTAYKDGVASTGNAGRAGYSPSVHIAPTNFFIQPGDKSLDELKTEMGTGLLLTEVSGLHAGLNAVSGDFSLLSKGFWVENGQVVRPVEQITVAGNFFTMLKDILAVGSDLRFPSGGVGCPSLYVRELSVAGK